MISYEQVRQYCRDDISKIENFTKAALDPNEIWHCHHILEISIDGKSVHNKESLKRLNMYYNRPYFELIFLTEHDHKSIHGKSRKWQTKEEKLEYSRKYHKEHKEHYRKLKQKYDKIKKGRGTSSSLL